MAYYNPYYRKPQTIDNKSNAPSRNSDEKFAVHINGLDKPIGDIKTDRASTNRPDGSNTARQVRADGANITKSNRSVSSQQPEIKAPNLSLSKEELIKGIIFSEIIAKPKAKRTGRL